MSFLFRLCLAYQSSDKRNCEDEEEENSFRRWAAASLHRPRPPPCRSGSADTHDLQLYREIIRFNHFDRSVVLMKRRIAGEEEHLTLIIDKINYLL